ncbi:hypothetical protein PR048_023307 [Dryococelus australis]|uniref:Uncharacterized protein n=1 Tax=Dryococelus australis TaxID=614101 RepID=A0ABQ9GTR4_9NEOP|nr:hypothetical protein PR048_023307 [Dryococelus australis]
MNERKERRKSRGGGQAIIVVVGRCALREGCSRYEARIGNEGSQLSSFQENCLVILSVSIIIIDSRVHTSEPRQQCNMLRAEFSTRAQVCTGLVHARPSQRAHAEHRVVGREFVATDRDIQAIASMCNPMDGEYYEKPR